jgi:MoxR-like ATPase
VEPVTSAAEVAKLVDVVRGVHVASSLYRYAVDIVAATRRSPDLRLGASPRATLHLVRAAKAWAALEQRDYVVPDDVQRLVVPVLAHRLLMSPEAAMGGRTAEQVLAAVLTAVPAPSTSGSQGGG